MEHTDTNYSSVIILMRMWEHKERARIPLRLRTVSCSVPGWAQYSIRMQNLTEEKDGGTPSRRGNISRAWKEKWAKWQLLSKSSPFSGYSPSVLGVIKDGFEGQMYLHNEWGRVHGLLVVFVLPVNTDTPCSRCSNGNGVGSGSDSLFPPYFSSNSWILLVLGSPCQVGSTLNWILKNHFKLKYICVFQLEKN